MIDLLAILINLGRRELQGLLVSGSKMGQKMISLLMRRARMIMKMGTIKPQTSLK
jgi:hypothetical protein